MFGRKMVAALVAEFLGTGALTLVILNIQHSDLAIQYFVSLAAGLAVAVLTFVFARSSGANFNPAITLGLWTARRLSTVTAFLYIVFQFLGAFGAYHLFLYFANTSKITPIGGHYTGRILITEAIASGFFAFCYVAVLAKRYTQATRAAFTGVAYSTGVYIASAAALGLLNPAVALGARAWVWGTYVLGPVIGGIVGINLYTLLFAEADERGLVAADLYVPMAVGPSSAPAAVVKKPSAKKRTTAKKK